MPLTEDRGQFTIYLDKSDLARVKEAAERNGRSTAAEIRFALKGSLLAGLQDLEADAAAEAAGETAGVKSAVNGVRAAGQPPAGRAATTTEGKK